MKPFFYLFLFVFFISISAALIATIVGFLSFSTSAHFFIPGHSLVGSLISLSALFTVAIPLLGLFYMLIKRARPYRLNPGFRRNIRFAWLAALFVTIFGVADTVRDFRYGDNFTTSEAYNLEGEAIMIDIVNPSNYYNPLFSLDDIKFSGSKLYADDLYIYLDRSEDDQIHIIKSVQSRGNDSHEAILNAKAVDHDVIINEGVIKIPSRFTLTRGEKYRGQHIEYRIEVPEGKKINFDERAQRYIVSTNFDEEYERPRSLKKYDWTMGENGLIAKSWLADTKYRKNIPLKNVSTFNIKGDFEVDIMKGNKNELALVGRQEIVDNIITVIQDNVISIVDEDNSMEYPVKLYIQVPELLSINSSSDRKLRLEGFDQSDMEIFLTGSGDVNAYLDVENLVITSEGKPSINLTGIGKELSLDMDYYTEFNGENFPVELLELKEKLGKARVKVKEKIKSIKELSRQMKIYGNPTIVIGEQMEAEEIEGNSQDTSVEKEIKKEIKNESESEVKEKDGVIKNDEEKSGK